MVEIPLAKVGLVTVADAADRLGRSVRGIQKLIADGHLPVVVAGGGKRTVYLIREADLKGFVPPTIGRPTKRKGKR